MTLDQVKMLVAAVIPEAGAANREDLAEALLSAAALKVGRMPAVMFNRQLVQFDLVSGQWEYNIGKDILSAYPSFWNFESPLYMKDSPGNRIEIVGLDHFSAYARGKTSTGYPKYGTVHSKTHIFEIYPIPNSNYTLLGLAKGNLDLNDIPQDYYDVLLKQSFLLAQAMREGTIAAVLVSDDEKQLQLASGTAWTGSMMRAYHRLVPGAGNPASSDNLTRE